MSRATFANDLPRAAPKAMPADEAAELMSSIARADILRRHIPEERTDSNRHDWVFQDIQALDLLAVGAERTADAIAELAKQDPSLAAALNGSMLEVGGGLAALSLALSRRFANAQYLVTDAYPIAVAQAQRKAAEGGCGHRIDVKLRDLTHIVERAAYNVIWLPAPILPLRGAIAAMSRLSMALRPAGYLIVGNCPQLTSDAETMTNGARLLRSTGQIWSQDELSMLLRAQGYRGFTRARCSDGVDLVICNRT